MAAEHRYTISSADIKEQVSRVRSGTSRIEKKPGNDRNKVRNGQRRTHTQHRLRSEAGAAHAGYERLVPTQFRSRRAKVSWLRAIAYTICGDDNVRQICEISKPSYQTPDQPRWEGGQAWPPRLNRPRLAVSLPACQHLRFSMDMLTNKMVGMPRKASVMDEHVRTEKWEVRRRMGNKTGEEDGNISVDGHAIYCWKWASVGGGRRIQATGT